VESLFVRSQNSFHDAQEAIKRSCQPIGHAPVSFPSNLPRGYIEKYNENNAVKQAAFTEARETDASVIG
jgi:hypothetical protein